MRQLNWRRWPLAVKLILTTTLSVTVAVAAVTLLSIHRERQNFRNELERQALEILEILAAASARAISEGDAIALDELMVRLGDRNTIVSGQIYNRQGTVLARIEPLPLEPEAQISDVRADPFSQELLDSDIVTYQWEDDRLRAGRAIVRDDATSGR